MCSQDAGWALDEGGGSGAWTQSSVGHPCFHFVLPSHGRDKKRENKSVRCRKKAPPQGRRVLVLCECNPYAQTTQRRAPCNGLCPVTYDLQTSNERDLAWPQNLAEASCLPPSTPFIFHHTYVHRLPLCSYVRDSHLHHPQYHLRVPLQHARHLRRELVLPSFVGTTVQP